MKEFEKLEKGLIKNHETKTYYNCFTKRTIINLIPEHYRNWLINNDTY